MKISIVIPTHNRATSLRRTMDSVQALGDDTEFEFIVVDNNSTDNTKEVVEEYGRIARYVFEGNTSFTKARGAGAANATGEILLYLDDDVIVHSGSLDALAAVFENHSDCGVVACKIVPHFEEKPPDWALACQSTFNGWSLFEPTSLPSLGPGLQHAPFAAGPMMAIRRTVYDEIGGFPPDTIGVETNQGEGTFRKLYVGPGDYGLCKKARDRGHTVLYAPDAWCEHVVFPFRSTVGFWRSRMIGEAHHRAISNREFLGMTRRSLLIESLRQRKLFRRWKRRLRRRIRKEEALLAESGFEGMLFEELWVVYHRAYIELDAVLWKDTKLSRYLWQLGMDGVSDRDFQSVIDRLPDAFIALVDSSSMYDDSALTSLRALTAAGL